MTMEAVLASLHLLAILMWVTFLASEAALCRMQWMNEAVVRRLGRLSLIAALAILLVFLSGIARIIWGAKGLEWYVSQPLFHWKMVLFFSILLLSLRPCLAIRQWISVLNSGGGLPDDKAVRSVRMWIMVQAHMLPVVAVIAVFWSRGM